MVAILDTGSGIAYIRAKAKDLNLDSAAVLAVSSQEGLSGNIGDNGHAFGPFQLNDAGGAFPQQLQGLSIQQKQAWAWSTAGIDYALNLMAGVAAGLTGAAAIEQLVKRFEKPSTDFGPSHRNLQIEEFNNAVAKYTQWLQGIPGEINPRIPVPGEGGNTIVPNPPVQGGTTVSPGVTTTAPQGVRLFDTPFGAITIPSGLILVLWAAILLLLGALLTFVEVKSPNVKVNLPQKQVG